MANHRRFFINPSQIDGSDAMIRGETARQITKVLRLREGDVICILDDLGNEHSSLITAVSRNEVSVRILGSTSCDREPTIHLTLAICLPKGDKLDLIVQKCAELGISKYVIVDSERVVTRPDSARAVEKIERWRRIASEAVEQCGGARVPEVAGIVGFPDLADEIAQNDLALIAWEEEKSVGLKQALKENASAKSVMLIVGPEGGLTESEVELAKSAGAKCVSLGRRVLRAETAAIAACAMILYELGDEL
ncbi:MAG: 16S rRNA (uracil(1498)-N(3))-methyltransferase [Armatimonadota bacterium]|nr:16S rRNA (uracil(1498)-N(3))-methyltransferase [bacterium]